MIGALGLLALPSVARAEAPAAAAAADDESSGPLAPRLSDVEPLMIPKMAAPPPAVVAPPLAVAPAPKPAPRRWGMFTGGVVLFALGYGGDIALTYSLGHAPMTTSLIPIVGPLVQMGQSWAVMPMTGGADAQKAAMLASINNLSQSVAYGVLAFDAVLQVAGLAMAVAGPLTKSHGKDRVGASSSPKISLAPGAGGRSALTVVF
jgi:hypothetical protein